MNISDKYLFLHSSDLESIKKVLANKKLSGTADIIEKYENKLAIFFQSKYAIATSSGTAALQTALFILEIDREDEVILSPLCPLMTILPLIDKKIRPIFCDTNIDNFGLNINDLKTLITVRTKAVIEVPMWGYPTDVEKLKKFLKTKNIPLILDLAQAHGTKINNHYLSSYGDISCFSTHDRKILATGEGGFVLTNRKDYYKKAKSFIQFGYMNGIDFGLNYKLGALQAALGFNRINYLQQQLNIRKKNAYYIIKNIKNPQVKEFTIIKNGKPNYYFLLLKLAFNHNLKFIKFLEEKGIPSDIIRYNYKVLYQYPMFSKFKRTCQNAERLFQNITTIPVHPGLNKKDLNYIISTINSF